MTEIKKFFNDNTMHIEAALGDADSNIKYCSKEGDFWEYGEVKSKAKIRETIKNKIEEFKTMDREEFITENLGFYTKYKKTLDEL